MLLGIPAAGTVFEQEPLKLHFWGFSARNKAKFLEEKGNTEGIFSMLVSESENTVCGTAESNLDLYSKI